MRYIEKQRTIPLIFSEIQETVFNTPDHSGYNTLSKNNRDQLINFLLKEQGHFFAYCNSPINNINSSLEHFICQSHNQTFDLNYYNLFLVCQGSQNKHCDKHRSIAGNKYFFPFIYMKRCKTISLNEVNPFFKTEIAFNKEKYVSGKILANNQNIAGYPRISEAVSEIIDVLNLNSDVLVRNRRTWWETVINLKNHYKLDWSQLFDHYLKSNSIYREFTLITIKQIIDRVNIQNDKFSI